MADKETDKDHESNPGTQPFVPEFENTGEHSVPFVPTWDDDTGSQPVAALIASSERKEDHEKGHEKHSDEPEPVTAEVNADADASGAPVQSVTVPGRYQNVKWWKLALVLFGVWAATAEVGLGLFYWWFHAVDKTPVVFMVLVYVVASAVVGVMLAMVQGRPMIAALSIAVMSGPFAAVAAAAPLYGYYYCVRMGHCLMGVIPY